MLDEMRVKIILTEPFAPFLGNVAMHPSAMVSPRAIETYGKDISQNPVGTGPINSLVGIRGSK